MNIILISPAKCNCWLIVNGEKSILVDAGYDGKINDFEHTLVENGLKPRDINMIIMTHTHFDHTCGLKDLKELTGARVVVNENEAGYLEQGFCPFPKGTQWYSGIISWIGRNLLYGISKFQPVSPDITLTVKLDLGRYGMEGYIMPTPGHTSGSQSLIMGEHAFVGDNMFGIFRNTIFPPFANDVPVLLKSWQELLDTGCKKFYPGHGKAIERSRIESELNRKKKRSIIHET
jgi:glyoxylase-like metal-dependent hydrolase (beta-lactamase superfamily II)